MGREKTKQFDIIKNIITKYNGPSSVNKVKKIKICGAGSNGIFDAANCSYIGDIIIALKQYNKSNNFQINKNEFNISKLLAAYDHIISVHRFCRDLIVIESDG